MSDKWMDDDKLKELGFSLNEQDNEEISTEMLEDMMKMTEPSDESSAVKKEVEVTQVVLEDLSEEPYSSETEKMDLSLLYNIPIDIRVVLGSVNKTVQEVVEMYEGQNIALQKLAGEPVDVLAGNQLIAKGEMVILEDKFGVFVTETVPPVERIRTVDNNLRRMKK